MCGIVGIFAQAQPRPELEAWCRAMADAIAYRGPDDSGAWVDPAVGLALAHRRLFILDLSPAGHQPSRVAPRTARPPAPLAEDLLNPVAMQRQGYLHPEPIQRLWRQHISGRFDHTVRLWTVLMWQAALEEWGG